MVKQSVGGNHPNLHLTLRTHLLCHLAGDVLQRLGERLVLVDLLLNGLA